ncbi:hypothetical protein [Alsobacter sp. R-9]
MCRAALLSLLALSALTGCQTSPQSAATGQGNLLLDAGFVARPASTPKNVALMKGLPANKFVKQTVNGTVTYLYADPLVCKCVYVGTPDAFQAYRNVLNVQQLISQPQFDAGLTISGIDNLDGWSEL